MLFPFEFPECGEEDCLRDNPLWDVMTNEEDDTVINFYKFDVLCFNDLFNHHEYRDSVIVFSYTKEATEESVGNARVIIIVSDIIPSSDTHRVDRHRFEQQIVCVLRAKFAE